MTEVVKSGNKKFWFAIFLFLCAIGLAGFNYYINLKTKRHMERQIHALSLNLQTQANLQNQQNSNFNANLMQMQDRLARLSADKIAIAKYQLNELIAFANQLLLVYHDSEDAIRVLNYAKNLLTDSHEAAFVGIKLTIANDIVRLNQLPKIDPVMLAGELDALISQIDKLAMVNYQPMKAIDHNTQTKSKWNKFITNVKDSLLGVIQISKIDNSAPLFVLPDEEFALRQGIKLDLLNARTAILERNNIAWHSSLEHVRINIQNYFTVSSARNQILLKLNELLKVDLGMADANIDQTIKALNQLNAL